MARAYPWGGAFDPRAAGHPRARRMRGIVVGADHHGGRSAARHGHHAAGAAGPGRGPPRRAPAVDRAVLVTDLRHRATGRHPPPVRAPARRQRDRAARRPAGGHVPAREHDDRRRARPALDGLRPRLRAVRPRLRLLHRPGRHDPRRRVPRRSDREPGRPRIAAACALDPAPREQPQRRAARVRPRRPALHRRRRRRLRGRPQPLRPGPQRPLREDPAHRPARQRGQPVHGARRQPVRRALGRQARDLRLRPAQPVALLLRPLHRRAGDRRRRPGQDRGGRLRGQGRGQGRQLRLERVRGPVALQPRQRARRGAAGAAADPRLRLVLDRRRLRRARRIGAGAARSLRLRRPVPVLNCTRRACARTRPRTGRSACGCRSSSRSGRMPPAMSTPCR